jgi:hypothetical protein
MSWHAGGLLIHTDTSADYPSLLNRLGLYGWRATPSIVSFERATCVGMTDLAIGCVNGWTTLWSDLVLDYLNLDGVKDVSTNADVFLMHLEGSCGFAHFAWWSDGTLVRRRMVCEGQVSVDEGDPLCQEAAVFSATDDEEDRVFLLMSKLALSAESLYETRYAVYTFPDITNRQPTQWPERRRV